LGSGGTGPVTSTLGLSATANDVSSNCINLYDGTTGINLTGSNGNAYIAMTSLSDAANLSGFATVTNLSVETKYVSLWAANTTSQNYTAQKINLVIY
jgi:hypothetical protein